MRQLVLGLICALVMAGMAGAEPVNEKQARKLLFPTNGAALVLVPDSGLTAGQLSIVEAILEQAQAQGAASYYGAVAVSPTFFGMMAGDPGKAATSGMIQISAQFHSAQAASRAALAACEAASQGRGAACVMAAQVLPRTYTPQPLQLSVAASEAFKAYRKARGAKAMAISPATTGFGIGQGVAAPTQALTDCNRRAQVEGQSDCVIVIED